MNTKKEIYTKQDDIDEALKEACNINNLNKIKYLLLKHPGFKANINSGNGEALTYACSNNHLEVVKYLLTSPELKEHANINANNDDALLMAIYHERLDIVKYLLTSPDLKKYPQINEENRVMKGAIVVRNTEIVEFLLTSPDLKEKADISYGFIKCYQFQYIPEFSQLIKDLIFNCNIDLTEEIKQYILDKPELKEMFRIRNFHNTLQNNLLNPSDNIKSNNKNKI